MKTSMLSLSALTIAIFVSFNLFAQKEAAPKKQKDKVLASKLYNVNFSQTGVKNPSNVADEISFKSGKLNSKFMTTQLHFPAGEYTIVSVDSAENYVEITFSAESQNPEGETVKWDGNVTDDAIEGSAVITSKKGKKVGEYTFSGNEKEKKGAKKK